jgi:hypothetical protein
MSELEIGHVTNRSGGRERVCVIIHCAHGPEAAPQPYITQHEEYDRLDMEQRASVVDEAVRKHRQQVMAEWGVHCDCRIPLDFRVERGTH